MAAFPAGFEPDIVSRLTNRKRIISTQFEDGHTVNSSISSVVIITFACSLSVLTAAERTTIRNFLRTNRYNVITWTIDSIAYTGNIIGYRETLIGDRYNMRFNYIAEEV